MVVLEFKFASKSSEVDEKRIEGKQQILDRGYALSYGVEGCKILTHVLIADDERKQVTL